MKILLLADEADPMYWEYLRKERLAGIDLILACGDLPASYLSYITCFTASPILYVPGNHDTKYAVKPPMPWASRSRKLHGSRSPRFHPL